MNEMLLTKAMAGDFKSLARCISLIENESTGFDEILKQLPHTGKHNIIGITGPPGAGKSTLTDGLIGALIRDGKKVAVLCVDPSSPFNFGALLGDRIRMSEWYNHPDVYIRSLATRGSLGGLHPSITEIADLVSACPFDYIIIETVGVGQSEVEIAGLADITVVVLVPEGGDEVQTMKAGLMEIADIFVVNKSDRPGADQFLKNLLLMLGPAFRSRGHEIPVLKTVASEHKGITELKERITGFLKEELTSDKKLRLLTERAWFLISKKRMKDLSKEDLMHRISKQLSSGNFNMHSFVDIFSS